MSQQDQIVVRLREMILDGELAPGQRLREVALAQRLQVSRTPVRRALRILEGEGLLAGGATRGCEVRAFTLGDMAGAIEVRGALEGYAARKLAMRGLSDAEQACLEECLETGERLLRKGMLVNADAQVFAAMNVRFHDAIVRAAGNQALSHAVALNECLPFAAAGAVALKLDTSQARAHQFALIRAAQAQHRDIVQALLRRQAARAEALMREHAGLSIDNMKLVMAARPTAPAAHGPDESPVAHDGCATPT